MPASFAPLPAGRCAGGEEPEEKKRSRDNDTHPAPDAARSAPDTAPNAPPRPRSAPAGDSPAAAVLAALTAEPGDATVAVIAGHTQISVAPAPALEAVGDPGTSAETTASAA